MESKANELVPKIKLLKSDIAEKHQAINTATFGVSSLKMMQVKVHQHLQKLLESIDSLQPMEEHIHSKLCETEGIALKLDCDIQLVDTANKQLTAANNASMLLFLLM